MEWANIRTFLRVAERAARIRWFVKCDRAQGRAGLAFLKAFHLVAARSHTRTQTRTCMCTHTHTLLIKDSLFNHISLSRTARAQRAPFFCPRQSNGDIVALPFHEFDAGGKCASRLPLSNFQLASHSGDIRREISRQRKTSLSFNLLFPLYFNLEPNISCSRWKGVIF